MIAADIKDDLAEPFVYVRDGPGGLCRCLFRPSIKEWTASSKQQTSPDKHEWRTAPSCTDLDNEADGPPDECSDRLLLDDHVQSGSKVVDALEHSS